MAKIQQAIKRLSAHALISGAIPSDVAGQPAYTVRVSPKHNGGLLGGAQLAWDAANGTPLRAAVYAAGDSSPGARAEGTDIAFGPVSPSVFDVSPPASAKVTNLTPRAPLGTARPRAASVIGLGGCPEAELVQGHSAAETRWHASRRDPPDLQRPPCGER